MILNKGKVAREMILKKEKITALRNDTCLSLAFVYGGTTRHTPRQSRLHGVLAQKKKLLEGLRSVMSRRLYFDLSRNISQFN